MSEFVILLLRQNTREVLQSKNQCWLIVYRDIVTMSGKAWAREEHCVATGAWRALGLVGAKPYSILKGFILKGSSRAFASHASFAE